MQQRHPVKHSTSLYQRLNEEAQRRRKEARGTPPGMRERLLRKARQADNASQMTEWLSSRGLRAPM